MSPPPAVGQLLPGVMPPFWPHPPKRAPVCPAVWRTGPTWLRGVAAPLPYCCAGPRGVPSTPLVASLLELSGWGQRGGVLGHPLAPPSLAPFSRFISPPALLSRGQHPPPTHLLISLNKSLIRSSGVVSPAVSGSGGERVGNPPVSLSSPSPTWGVHFLS